MKIIGECVMSKLEVILLICVVFVAIFALNWIFYASPQIIDLSVKGNTLDERANLTRTENNTLLANKQIDKVEDLSDVYIHHGYGSKEIFLGMSRADLLKVKGIPNEEYNHTGYCSYTEIHWIQPTRADGSLQEGNGIFAYLKDDKVFEISFSGNQYYTKDNIKYGILLKELGKKGAVDFYILSPSANAATYNEDLVYAVESENGISYELGVGYKTKERYLYSIYVFTPFEKFLPFGCISESQTFNKISTESN